MDRRGGRAPEQGRLPLYVRLSERLIREIASGQVPDGSRLPPEREMARDLGASVGTLRKALADLAAKGLLDRIQGSGNYVHYRADVASVYAFFRLERREGGGLPTAEILDLAAGLVPPEAARFDMAHRIRRLRLLEGEPVALEEIWLDARFAAVIDEAAISESLYLYYRDVLGLVIERVEDSVGLGQVPDWTVPAFDPARGATCPFVERRSRDETGVVVEYSRTWFDNEKARYVSRMGRG